MDWLKKLLGITPAPRGVNILGRNELCWCGSGAKYKRCHMESDRARARARNRVPCATS
jgi:uncharacterized protein YecA (UPF0149 family)